MGVVAAREESCGDLHHEPDRQATDEGRNERKAVDDRASACQATMNSLATSAPTPAAIASTSHS